MIPNNLYFRQNTFLEKPQQAPINYYQKANVQPQFSVNTPISSQISIKIKSMIQHVSKSLIRLLDNLDYLYTTNGIKYQVHEYYKTLMRLLTPHQLLSQFHIVDNHELFKGQQQQLAAILQCKYQEDFNLYIQKSKKYKKYRPSQQQNQTKSDKNTLENIANDRNLIIFNHKKNIAYQGGKALLGEDLQTQVAKWVLQQLNANRPLIMKDIAQKTKEIAHKFKGFKCSIGWVNRFLTRHPYLRLMMKYCKQRNHRAVKQIYYKVKKVLQKQTLNQQIMNFNSFINGEFFQQPQAYNYKEGMDQMDDLNSSGGNSLQSLYQKNDQQRRHLSSSLNNNQQIKQDHEQQQLRVNKANNYQSSKIPNLSAKSKNLNELVQQNLQNSQGNRTKQKKMGQKSINTRKQPKIKVNQYSESVQNQIGNNKYQNEYNIFSQEQFSEKEFLKRHQQYFNEGKKDSNNRKFKIQQHD